MAYTQNWDGVTPPAIPAGWTTDTHITTSAIRARSGANSLAYSLGDGSAGHFLFYSTLDSNSGNVSVSSAFYLTTTGGEGYVLARCSSTVQASFNGYALQLAGSAAATAVILQKVTGGAFTQIGSGGGTAIGTGGWYVATLTCSGSTITGTVQRDSDGLFLTSSGTWSATPQAAVTVTDTTYGASAGYSGVGFFTGLASTVFADDFLLTSSSTITPTPNTLIANSGNQTITLAGFGTAFNTGSTSQFTLSGGTGASIVSQSASTGTAASLTINPGTAAGTLTITDTTDGNITCTITVVPVTIAVSPTTATINTLGTQAITPTVTNNGTGSANVNWTVDRGGAVSPTTTASGTLTTFTPSATGTSVVTATSVADGSKTATCTITVTNPPPITVQVTPVPPTMPPLGTQQFAAVVANTTNHSVTWSITEGASGGSVSSGGLYTAPATPGTYHLTATSAADNTKSATATIVVAAVYYRWIVAPFTSDKAGLSTVGYQLIATDGTTVTASRTTASVVAIIGVPASYGCYVPIPIGFIGTVAFDTGDSVPGYAVQQINLSDQYLDATISSRLAASADPTSALTAIGAKTSQLTFLNGAVEAYGQLSPIVANAAISLNLVSASTSYSNAVVQQLRLSIVRNTDEVLAFTAVGGTPAVPVDLSGATLQFLVKRNLSDADSAALLTKNNAGAGGIVVVNATAGAFTLTLSNTDFSNATTFPDGAGYYFGLKLYAANGIESPIAQGTIRVLPFPVTSTAIPT